MDANKISELWLSENGSMALFRMRRGLGEPEETLLAHIVRHELQPMRLLYTRDRPGEQGRPSARCEVYRLGVRTAVVEQVDDQMQVLIAASALQHRSLRFQRIEPDSNPAARQLAYFLHRLERRR